MNRIQNVDARYKIYKSVIYWWAANEVEDLLGYSFDAVRISGDNRYDQTMMLLSICDENLYRANPS